ncbi:hypothetical protein C0995_011361 [Termitomyces sp. Mi166|nr:hypothetical protein C0995_011361 [Termitomyces sp. Mi166\
MVTLNVIGLSFSNYTLKYVDASFYQVARGLVLPFTIVTSYLAFRSIPSLRILVACGVVTIGFFIGVFLDGTPVSMLGVFFGVVSSGITALHSVVIKESLKIVDGSALLLSWYTNLLSAIVLLPICLFVGEGPGIMEIFFSGEVVGTDGAMVTSPITHMVSSAVRGVAASLLGMWLFHDVITSGRATSIATILFGSIYYTWVKNQETQKPYERVKMEDIESGKEYKPK